MASERDIDLDPEGGSLTIVVRTSAGDDTNYTELRARRKVKAE
jgi:hypothetical protein